MVHVSHTCLLPILVPARLHKLFGSGSALNDAEVGVSQHAFLSKVCFVVRPQLKEILKYINDKKV